MRVLFFLLNTEGYAPPKRQEMILTTTALKSSNPRDFFLITNEGC